MEGTSNSTYPISLTALPFEIALLALGGLLIIIALVGSVPSPWGRLGPARKLARVVAGAVGGILILLAVFLTVRTSQPVEVCSYINPLIAQPVHGGAVSSPTTVQGTVSEVPKNSFLWLMIYDHKKATYINALQLTVDGRKQWRKQVDFIGSMVGSTCTLEVILADATTHSQLNQFAETRQTPLNISRCTQVEVRIGQ